MAQRANLIATYNANPTLQGQYTQQQYLDLFDFGLQTPTPTPTPTPPPSGGVTNIIGQDLNQGGGGGGGVPTSPAGLTQDFMTATQERQNRLTNPGKVASFVGDFIPQQRDIGAMIRSGVTDERLSSGLPLGLSGMVAKALPDKYYDMSLGDQVFTQSQMGYTGPTVFGENTSGLNKDPFGLNTRSAFGNYAEAVGKDFANLSESLSTTGAIGSKKDFQGATFNEETGEFESDTLSAAQLDALNQRTNMVRSKFKFRRDQLNAKNKLDAQIKAAEAEKQRQAELQRKIAAEAAAGKSLSQIGRENFTGEGQAFEARKDTFTGGKTVDSPSTPGGKYSSPRKDGGLMYADGGRVYLYNRLK